MCCPYRTIDCATGILPAYEIPPRCQPALCFEPLTFDILTICYRTAAAKYYCNCPSFCFFRACRAYAFQSCRTRRHHNSINGSLVDRKEIGKFCLQIIAISNLPFLLSRRPVGPLKVPCSGHDPIRELLLYHPIVHIDNLVLRYIVIPLIHSLAHGRSQAGIVGNIPIIRIRLMQPDIRYIMQNEFHHLHNLARCILHNNVTSGIATLKRGPWISDGILIVLATWECWILSSFIRATIESSIISAARACTLARIDNVNVAVSHRRTLTIVLRPRFVLEPISRPVTVNFAFSLRDSQRLTFQSETSRGAGPTL